MSVRLDVVYGNDQRSRKPIEHVLVRAGRVSTILHYCSSRQDDTVSTSNFDHVLHRAALPDLLKTHDNVH